MRPRRLTEVNKPQSQQREEPESSLTLTPEPLITLLCCPKRASERKEWREWATDKRNKWDVLWRLFLSSVTLGVAQGDTVADVIYRALCSQTAVGGQMNGGSHSRAIKRRKGTRTEPLPSNVAFSEWKKRPKELHISYSWCQGTVSNRNDLCI